MATDIVYYDKYNKQDPYKYFAKSKKGEWVNGYVVAEQPWETGDDMKTYYIVFEDYRGGGFCGGSYSDGFIKVAVDKDSIIPATQLNRLAVFLSYGNNVEIRKPHDSNEEYSKFILRDKQYDNPFEETVLTRIGYKDYPKLREIARRMYKVDFDTSLFEAK